MAHVDSGLRAGFQGNDGFSLWARSMFGVRLMAPMFPVIAGSTAILTHMRAADAAAAASTGISRILVHSTLSWLHIAMRGAAFYAIEPALREPVARLVVQYGLPPWLLNTSTQRSQTTDLFVFGGSYDLLLRAGAEGAAAAPVAGAKAAAEEAAAGGGSATDAAAYDDLRDSFGIGAQQAPAGATGYSVDMDPRVESERARQEAADRQSQQRRARAGAAQPVPGDQGGIVGWLLGDGKQEDREETEGGSSGRKSLRPEAMLAEDMELASPLPPPTWASRGVGGFLTMAGAALIPLPSPVAQRLFRPTPRLIAAQALFGLAAAFLVPTYEDVVVMRQQASQKSVGV